MGMVSVKGGVMVLLESSQKAHRFVLIAPNGINQGKEQILVGAKRPPSDLTSMYLTESLMSKKLVDFQESD